MPVRQSTGAYRCGICGKDCDPPLLVTTAMTTTTTTVVASGGQSDGDGWGEMSLFSDDDDDDTPSTPPVRHASRDGERLFWDLLDVANGQNDSRMGKITLLNGLQDQLKDPGQNNGGLMYIRAVPTDGGWILYGDHTRMPGAEPVYFLPWKKGHTVYAKRSWYENSVCNYFLTTKLTGCRFSITKEHVLHVAADAWGASDDASGSGKRTEAEGSMTKGVLKRRLSSSGLSAEDGEPRYRGLSYVFGMRTSAGWVYKIHINHTDAWTTIWTAQMGSGSG